MFNLDAITNKNNKDDDKKWPYRMLIIGPSGSGKTNLSDVDPMKVLKNIRQKHSNRLVIAQLNFNSIRNKFTSLSNMTKDNIDILLISETKIDSCFT